MSQVSQYIVHLRHVSCSVLLTCDMCHSALLTCDMCHSALLTCDMCHSVIITCETCHFYTYYQLYKRKWKQPLMSNFRAFMIILQVTVLARRGYQQFTSEI